jgi:hypothetical protein
MAELPFDQWVEETGLAAKLRAEGDVRAEAKYRPVLEEKDRENQELRRRLREAGLDP